MGKVDLAEVRCGEQERRVASEYGVRFACRLFQLLKTHRHLPPAWRQGYHTNQAGGEPEYAGEGEITPP
ncbi:MAG: hypothetical protein LBG24_07375 [Treponema sp.]|nr:hypothetical protein [Treponema sp.]